MKSMHLCPYILLVLKYIYIYIYIYLLKRSKFVINSSTEKIPVFFIFLIKYWKLHDCTNLRSIMNWDLGIKQKQRAKWEIAVGSATIEKIRCRWYKEKMEAKKNVARVSGKREHGKILSRNHISKLRWMWRNPLINTILKSTICFYGRISY